MGERLVVVRSRGRTLLSRLRWQGLGPRRVARSRAVAGNVFLGLWLSLFVVACHPPASDAPVRGERLRGWEGERNLTSDAWQSQLAVNFARSMAIDQDGGVHVVWFDNRNAEHRVHYRRSVNGGADWDTELPLSETSSLQEWPSIAASGRMILVVWQDGRHGGQTIYFRKSDDQGRSWLPEQRISSVNTSAHASVAACGTNVYIVWGDVRDGQAETYLRASSDGGRNWGPEVRISEPPWDSWVPTIAASGDSVYVAWVDTQDGNEEEYFRQSPDRGVSWGPITRLTRDGANSWAPTLAAEGDTVHLVWFDQKDSPVQPFEAEAKLNEAMDLLGLEYEPAPPGVVVPLPEEAARRRIAEKMQLIGQEESRWIRRGGDGAKLRSLLAEFGDLGRSGAPSMVQERKLDEVIALMGLAYSPGPLLDGVPRGDHWAARRMRFDDKLWQIGARAPGWVADGGDFASLDAILGEFQRMAQSSLSEWEIYHLRSTDGGLTWGFATRLTRADGASSRPSVAMSGERIVVAWFDNRDGDFEIYFKESLDGGGSWGPDVRLTSSPGDSIMPTIAICERRVHVLWSDGRDGNGEIYYKRSTSRLYQRSPIRW